MAAAADVAFLVLSAETVGEGGATQKGSKLVQLDARQDPPAEWRLRDFAFAAFSQRDAAGLGGLREVHFGRRSVWAFATPRKHCEEIAVFRRASDTRRRWDGEALHEPKVGLDKFFLMRMRQVTEETPLSHHFNGEWGFWESFFAPILDDDEQRFDVLFTMAPDVAELYFQPCRLPVTCHMCPPGHEVLTIPEDLVVKHRVLASCSDVAAWSDVLNKLGEDMVLQFPCVVQGVPLKPGSECVRAASEMDGVLEGSRLKKLDLEALRLPLVLGFECDMAVAAEWRPDVLHLQRKIDQLGQAYESNLMNGYSALGRLRPDPWNPMSRLAVNALSQVLARFPEIRSVLDVGCGDMAWMQYVLAEHPQLTYVGVDIVAYCLAIDFRRFPKMQFIQTDLSNSSGIEVLPQGCDLVVAKEVFNQMVLPDAVDALRRVVSTRPRFLLTHIHAACDNTGWEARIDKHLEYTPYDYNKPPFSLPYPVMHVQRISDEAAYVLYQISPDKTVARISPPMVESMPFPPLPEELDDFSTVAAGEWTEPQDFCPIVHSAPESSTMRADELGPRPSLAEVPAGAVAGRSTAVEPPKPIKGVPAAEFRARCDLIFEKFDRDRDNVLNFEELAALMDAGGRRIEEYEAYAALCGRLGCDARVGLSRRDVYKLFEKAPQSVWEEVYRSINPLAQMVVKGAARLPETFLERPLPNFLFDDGDAKAKVIIEVNDHLYFGAAEVVSALDVQAFFGKQRLEVHIAAPGSYKAKDLYLWKLVVTPLSGEIVPEDCTLDFKESQERGGIRGAKITVRLTKSKPKRWGKVGQAVTGQRI